MRSIRRRRESFAAPPRGSRAVWALSAAALGVALVPGGAPWAAPLFALAIACWAWLAYGGRRGRDGDDAHDRGLAGLIAASSRTAGDDLRALRADLGQVRTLVHDAAATLGDGFQGLDATLRGGGAAGGRAPEAVENLEVLIRALQFEDVARQLLEYCDHQVAGLESYADDLVTLLGDAKLHGRPAERESRLIRACERYLENSRLWATRRQRHITQTSMRAGDIELF
ncbi:MAG: hypothetical protein IT489_04180 [Gammaproteobacteria bacterium]|nr:hypothetical protein [Gammaproteobacteria bacterium]